MWKHRQVRRCATGLAGGIVTLLTSSLFVVPVRAQSPIILPELPFTARQGIGARAAGMGFAYGALSEDGAALFYNPAGLAQIRRIEVSGGIVHDAQSRSVAFDTGQGLFPGTGVSTRSTDVSATQLNSASVVYPFPTYRGSVVVGFAYQRSALLTSDYLRGGYLVSPSTGNPGLFERESFTESGGVDFWTAGIGGDVSPHVSLGATVSFISGSTDQQFEVARLPTRDNGTLGDPYDSSSNDVFRSVDTRTADLTGVTGSAGALAQLTPRARLGLTVFMPQRYDFEGSATSFLRDREKTDTSNFSFTDKITLPFSFLASLAVTPENFVIAADARLTDWTQTSFEGQIRRSDRENAYRSTVELNVGAEYRLPGYPASFRAGFSSQPLPYKLIPADITFDFVPDDGNPNTTNDASSWSRLYPDARIMTDRRFFTAGAGTIIDGTLAIDLAYVHGMFERSGASVVSEKWTTNQVFGTATVRF